jgi:hypothetical protein
VEENNMYKENLVAAVKVDDLKNKINKGVVMLVFNKKIKLAKIQFKKKHEKNRTGISTSTYKLY